MKHLSWMVCVLLVANTVSGQETSAPSTPNAAGAPETAGLAPLVIEVRAQRVSRSALSEALLKELRQAPARGDVETPRGALELSDADGKTVRLIYRDATGRETKRDLYLEPDDPEALEKITIAAANLVRDQTGALSQLEAERHAEEDAALQALAAPPAAAPVAPEAAPAPIAAKAVYDPCRPPLTIPFGVDLAWLVGTSSTSLGREAARRVSIGLAGTYSAGTRGVELSILANIDRRGTCGLQVAAGVNVAVGNVRGLQLAVLNLALAHVRGAQLAVANFARGGSYGLQLGVLNLSLAEAGLQLGVANIAASDTRAQIGVANFARGTGRAQIGVANLYGGSTRAQIGVLNVATDVTRVQVGVVNYARRARAPIGAISIVRDGHTTLDAWVNENGTLYGMLTHGGDRVYNMYGAGTRVGKDGARMAMALGIAARLYSDARFSLDLQGLHELYPRLSPWRNRIQVTRLRLAADVKLTRRISLVPAVGYALMNTEYESERTQAPFGESTLIRPRSNGGKRREGLYGFPSFGLGLRILLSDPKRPRD